MTFVAARHDRYSAAPADPRPGPTDPRHPPPSDCAYPPHDPAQRRPQPHRRPASRTLPSVDRPSPPEPPTRGDTRVSKLPVNRNQPRKINKAEETSTIRYRRIGSDRSKLQRRATQHALVRRRHLPAHSRGRSPMAMNTWRTLRQGLRPRAILPHGDGINHGRNCVAQLGSGCNSLQRSRHQAVTMRTSHGERYPRAEDATCIQHGRHTVEIRRVFARLVNA